jgi:ABC-2 type transport system ATP-binding protein
MQNFENDVVLQTINLNKLYGDRHVVKNVNLTIHKGEIFGFLGPNGAGKSTTIKMIAGLTSISSGDVVICGKNLRLSFEKAIRNIGGVIETPTLYDYMSGYNNLKFFASLYPNISHRRIMEVASFVGLESRIKDKVSQYSLGMKQRLGIAQALLHSPKLLILDEPTNGLDANGIKEIRMLLKQLAHEQGIAILISSHILSEMENLCDMIAIINKGEVIEQKTLEEIKHKVRAGGSMYIRSNAVNFAGKLIQEYTKEKVAIANDKIMFNGSETALAEIIILLTKNKISVFAAGEVDFSLEDVFLNIIGQYNKSTSIS